MISIVGLGYGDINDIRLGTFKILKEADVVYTKISDSLILKQLKDEGIVLQNINCFREVLQSGDGRKIVYAVFDNQLNDMNLIEACKNKNIKYELHESTGIKLFLEKCIGEEIDQVEIVDSYNFDETKIDRKKEVVITGLKDLNTLKAVKENLLKIYYEDVDIYHIKVGDCREANCIKIRDLDKMSDIDDCSMLYIRRNSKGKNTIFDLAEIIEILRGKDGCPWDKEQTHESIKKDIVEESYEVLDAIEKNDIKAFVEELGDVLFQVMFHASIGREKKEFSILDITDGITNKMIFRHPHVFGNINVSGTKEVLANWDELKKSEKKFKNVTDELEGIAKALPALIRAKKVQKKAKKVGFDWDDVSEAFEKVKEELNEVMDVYNSEKMVRIKEEIGDLLFSCVNVSRFLEVDPEEALNLTTNKFIRRFNYIESKAKEQHKSMDDMSLADMDKLWEEAKMLENR